MFRVLASFFFFGGGGGGSGLGCLWLRVEAYGLGVEEGFGFGVEGLKGPYRS